MPRDDGETVRDFFQEVLALGPLREWGQSEIGVFDRWTTPDVEYREDPKWPGAGVYRTRSEVLGAFMRYSDVFPDMSGSLEAVRTGDDGVVALVRFKGQAAASGVPNEHLWAYVCHTDGERIASVRAYWDPNEALEVAGLSE